MTTAVPRLGAEALDDLERFGRRPLAGLVLGPERRARHVLVEGE